MSDAIPVLCNVSVHSILQNRNRAPAVADVHRNCDGHHPWQTLLSGFSGL